MTSKHLWIAELQNVNGRAVEFHSLELEPEHYKDRSDWNRAMTSWSAFRQRERKNLKPNRMPNSKVQWACHWMTPDDITFVVMGMPEDMKHHKTIWDLYDAIGYDYKAKKYDRQVVIAADPGTQAINLAEVTFGKGIPLKVRTITSNHGCAFISCDAEAETIMQEPKRMRGDVPGMVHIDESGFMDKNGDPIYVASADGEAEFLVNERKSPIPEKLGVVTTSSTVESATVTERAALGAGMVAEPASLEEANRLRAKVGLDPLLAQPAPEGFEFTSPNPGVWQEPAGEHGAEGELGEKGIEDVVHEVEYPAIKNPFNGANITEAQARAIADRVNAEPNIDAKKRILKDQLQHFASEREGALEAEKLRSQFRMPGDRKNDPKVIAHKRSVVKSYQKIKRQQAKAEKMKALQVKAFNGK
jgi:hypothetical protein